MARRNHRRLGDGARCSVLLSKLRPSERVADAFPNSESTQRLDDLVALRRQRVTRRGLSYEAIFFSSASIPNIEVPAARRFVVVVEQGPDKGLWDEVANNPAPGNPPLPDGDADHIPIPIENEIFNLRGTAEDIAMVRNQGFDVDDDNEPVPKNVPTDDGPTVDDNPGDGMVLIAAQTMVVMKYHRFRTAGPQLTSPSSTSSSMLFHTHGLPRS